MPTWEPGTDRLPSTVHINLPILNRRRARTPVGMEDRYHRYVCPRGRTQRRDPSVSQMTDH
ncbi:hypothetical protein SCOCK_10167 [Actinacidiphila cocklensis]|uniref:Uncharacterized protein n=1 Tax=Actinacidiphila cocklensis TaxID=887465 RepID=A0A9W4GPM9_9ACTN|nr:hypothetical protein SCOCK_10167 [Actinacidiphila cocklensis]